MLTDSPGRWSRALCTSCGITDLVDYSARSEEPLICTRVGGPLFGDDGRAPKGWNRPFQRGWMSIDGDGLRFEDERGYTEHFERAPAGCSSPSCEHGMSE